MDSGSLLALFRFRRFIGFTSVSSFARLGQGPRQLGVATPSSAARASCAAARRSSRCLWTRAVDTSRCDHSQFAMLPSAIMPRASNLLRIASTTAFSRPYCAAMLGSAELHDRTAVMLLAGMLVKQVPDRINIEWSKPQLGRDTPPFGLLAGVMVMLIVMHLALPLEFLRSSQIGKARCVAIEMKPHSAGLSAPLLRDDEFRLVLNGVHLFAPLAI